MKKLLILLFVSILFSPALHAQKTVIGTVDYTYKIVGEGAEAMAGMMPNKMVVKYGENGLTMEMKGGMMAAAMGKTVVNGETGEAFMIKESEKTIYLMSDEEIDAAAGQVSDPEIETLSETMTILGYKCQKYIQTSMVQGTSVKQIIWATKDLATPKYEGKAFKGMAGQGGINLEIDGFPMLIEVDMPGMPVQLKLEVSNIEFEKINKSEFKKPASYTVKPFSAMNPF